MANFDVIIVGGGVIGLSIARQAHRAGMGRIAVIERGKVGREASWAAAGMLAPNAENESADDFYRLCDASRRMYPSFAEELAAETGIDVELDRTGTLYASFTEDDSRHLATRYERQLEASIPVERVSRDDVLRAEPQMSERVLAALYFPNDWQVENRRLITALETSIKAAGVTVLEGADARQLIVEGTRVKGVDVGGTPICAASTVIAAGAWTSLIAVGKQAFPVAVKPIRGQMIAYRPPINFARHVIYSPRGYVVPRADGRILAGATVEDVGFDKHVTGEAVLDLGNAASEIFPALDGLTPVEKWAGLRPFAGDGLPVIGPLPGYQGLILAAGHYRNGILLAPITARLVADELAGIAGADHGAFSPGRFGPAELNAAAP